jgi:pectinesterase
MPKSEGNPWVSRTQWTCFLLLTFCCGCSDATRERTSSVPVGVAMLPADKARDVNPDTHLELTFPSEPNVGTSGQVRVYDAADDRLVDTLDMSIPPGPRNTRTSAPYDKLFYKSFPSYSTMTRYRPNAPVDANAPAPGTYQINYVGGKTDGDAYHFFPVLIHGRTATINLHNHCLEYGKRYYVQIDPGVLTVSDGSFKGIAGKKGWTFTTKKAPLAAGAKRLVVSPDGTGDFCTIQGAIDSIPDKNPDRVTIFIKNGTYEEMVYFRRKENVTFLGEDRDKVVICYANNAIFNPPVLNVKTGGEVVNHNRRAAMAVDRSTGIWLVNVTAKSLGRAPAQAEGLLVNGSKNIVYDVNIVGSGDALQSNGSAYYERCRINGAGDTILTKGPGFFKDCQLASRGAYMWVRNTNENHGNVFVDCKFSTLGGGQTVIARCPTNKGIDYPYCEVVLINCGLSGISPEGWGPLGGDTSKMRQWEYNSTNISDGKPVDVSHRHPASRQLTMEKDAETIANYSNPTYVLGGWTPAMAPIILAQPQSVTAERGRKVSFSVKVAAVPEASYQWLWNGKPIGGSTTRTLSIEAASPTDAGEFSVAMTNPSGSVTSQKVTLTVK